MVDLSNRIPSIFTSLIIISTLSSCELDNSNLDNNRIDNAQENFVPLIEDHASLMGSIDLSEEVSTTASKAKTVILKERNASKFANALINAVKNAGNGGIVQLESGNYYSDKAIELPANIRTTIKGKGKFETKLYLTKKLSSADGLIILNANGSSVQSMIVDVNNNISRYGSSAVATNGKDNIYLYKVGFSNSSFGTGVPPQNGQSINGLKIVGCSFYNCGHGLAFNRLYSGAYHKKVAKVEFMRCWFGGKQIAGISIDCGNDGIDGNDRSRTRDLANEATQTVTYFDGLTISGCTFKKAKKYNIAIAKSRNIIITHNTLEGNTGEINYGEAINLEHETRDITIQYNTIKNLDVDNKVQAYISVLAFSDYDNTDKLENGCRNIDIIHNNFSGDVNNGIVGKFAEGVDIFDNTFNNPKPRVNHINFYNQSSNIRQRDNNGIDLRKVTLQ